MSDKYVMLRCANCGEAVVLDEDYEYYGDGTSERRYALTHAYGYPMCRNTKSSPLSESGKSVEETQAS